MFILCRPRRPKTTYMNIFHISISWKLYYSFWWCCIFWNKSPLLAYSITILPDKTQTYLPTIDCLTSHQWRLLYMRLCFCCSWWTQVSGPHWLHFLFLCRRAHSSWLFSARTPCCLRSAWHGRRWSRCLPRASLGGWNYPRSSTYACSILYSFYPLYLINSLRIYVS